MRKVKKLGKIILLLLIIGNIAAAFTACQTHYNRSEISEYLKNQIPNKEFIISKNYVEYEGSDHDIDRVWDVYLKENPDLVFKVISDKHLSGEFAAFDPQSNFSDVYGLNFYKLYSEKKHTNIKWQEGVGHENDEYFRWGSRLYISFSNRYELKQAVEELKEFYAFLDSKGYPIELPFTIEYLSNVIKVDKDSTTDGEYNARKFDSSTLEEVTKMYAQCLIDYRLDNMNEFTKEELIHYTTLSKEQFELTTSNGNKVKYNDMLLSSLGYGMSFGSIYELLIRNGFQVNGNSNHFSFLGIDGNQYEFSYEFNNYPYEQSDGEVKKGYYYIKNGQKKVLSNYFYNHINSALLKEITGMSFNRLETK